MQQGKRRSLCTDFSWTFVGNAIYAGGQFATLMLLAKLVRPELVGQYALGLAVVYPVMMLTNMQLRAVMTSGARRQIHFGHYLSLRLLTTSLALVIIFAITQILGYRWELTAVVLMVGGAYAIETISDVYYARLQLHDRMVEISKSLIARALLSVPGLAVATYVSRNLLWGVAGVLLARAIVLFGYDICERTHGLGGQSKWFSRNEALSPRLNLRVQSELLWLSLPLGIVVLLTSLNASVPSYFIKQALGDRELGIFSAIGFMISVGGTRDPHHPVPARIRRASRPPSLDYGDRERPVYGPVFGIRDDRGWLLQFTGRTEYSCEPKPFSSLLLVGCTAGAARGVPRDADRCDRAACRERRDSSHRPANTRPCVCRKG